MCGRTARQTLLQRLRDGQSPGVVDGNTQVKAAAFGGCGFGAFDLAQQRPGDAIAAADDLKTRALLTETLALEAKKGTDDPEDALYLLGRTRPVVG